MSTRKSTQWQSVKLGDVVSFTTGKLNSNAAAPDGAYPFFTCSQETLRTNTCSFDTECVLLAGNNANGIYPIKYFSGKFDAYQRTYVIRSLDRRRLDNRYLYFALQPKLELLRNISTGAATKFLTLTILKDLVLHLPPFADQRAIVEVLSAYDDLIENSTRRIKVLEEMAQAIYHEWFVRFRFPGHEKVKMFTSEQGPLPQTWSVQQVRELVKRLKARRVYTDADVVNEGNVPVIDQSRTSLLGYHDDAPDFWATPSNPIVVFGDHTCKMQLMVEPFSVGPNVVPFVSNTKLPILYLFFVIRNLVETKEYKRHWTELTNKAVIVGAREVAEEFARSTTTILEEINLLMHKNENLRRSRDLLLPKLIAGEIPLKKPSH
jgi:type I restriction enzyme S subunit